MIQKWFTYGFNYSHKMINDVISAEPKAGARWVYFSEFFSEQSSHEVMKQ